jgi:hypothetical protein
MLYHYFSVFETANTTSDDKFTLCHVCYCLSCRTANRRRIYTKSDLGLVVEAFTVSYAYEDRLTLNSFYINLPCGGIAAIAMLFAFRAPKAASPTPATAKEKFLQMDIPGAIFVCATIVCFTLALRWAGVEKT